MDVKDRLLALLQEARDEEKRFAQWLSEEGRAESGAEEAWAPKDMLVHLAVWKHTTAQYLVAGRDGRPFEFHEDLDQENAAIFHRYQHHDWESVQEIMDLSYRELLNRIGEMPEEDLLDVDKFPWLNGRSFWERIVHNGAYHPIWHLSLMYAARGAPERGLSLLTTFSEKLLALDDSPHWQGHYLYNLACFRTRIGQVGPAIEILADAFHLRPELRDWSRQDQDLAPMWGEPDYRELVEKR